MKSGCKRTVLEEEETEKFSFLACAMSTTMPSSSSVCLLLLGGKNAFIRPLLCCERHPISCRAHLPCLGGIARVLAAAIHESALRDAVEAAKAADDVVASSHFLDSRLGMIKVFGSPAVELGLILLHLSHLFDSSWFSLKMLQTTSWLHLDRLSDSCRK